MPTVLQHINEIVQVHKVSDGDTYWCYMRLDFHEHCFRELRLMGYDTPESRSSATRRISDFERAEAQRATGVAAMFMQNAIDMEGAKLLVRSEPDPEKFGRWLATIWLESDDDRWPERHLGAELRSRGLASVYDPSNRKNPGKRWYEEFDAAAGA